MSRLPCSKNKGSLWAKWAPVSFGLQSPSIYWDVTQYFFIIWLLFMILIFCIITFTVFRHFSTFLLENSVSDAAVFDQSADNSTKMHNSRNATMCNAFPWICFVNFRFQRAVLNHFKLSIWSWKCVCKAPGGVPLTCLQWLWELICCNSTTVKFCFNRAALRPNFHCARCQMPVTWTVYMSPLDYLWVT